MSSMNTLPERPSTPISMVIGMWVVGLVLGLLVLSWLIGLITSLIKFAVIAAVVGAVAYVIIRLR